MTFEPENDLERALMAAAGDAAARPAFYHALLEADIYIIPAGKMPQAVNGVLPTGTTVALASLTKNGVSFTPFYSSELRVRQSLQTEMQWLRMGVRPLMEMTRGAHLVLNPGQAYGKEFLPDEVARLLDGTFFAPRETYVTTKPTQVLLGQPANYPQEMVDALRRLFATLPAVNKAYMAQYVNPSRDPDPGLLICLDINPAQDADRVMADAGLVASDALQTHKFVDFVRYDSAVFADYFHTQQPFYQRGLIARLLGGKGAL